MATPFPPAGGAVPQQAQVDVGTFIDLGRTSILSPPPSAHT
jgi:hypothetical protein